MSNKRLFAAACPLLLLFTQLLQSCQALEKTWALYHSLNGGQDFSRRATVSLALVEKEEGQEEVELTVINDNSTLNDETFASARKPGAMYQLKLVEGDGGHSSEDFLLTSVPACQLLRANFREEIILTFGSHASAISLTYIPLVSPLAPKTCDNEYWEQKRSNLPEGWETRISWETSTPGMVLRTVMPNYKPPPGLHWLPRVGANGNLYQAQGPPGTGGEQGGTGGGPEQEQAPMAFLRRYWYILLPLFIMNFFGAPEAPPAEGQSGQAAGGGAAPAGGAAAPAAAPAAGASPPKSRRGKRG